MELLDPTDAPTPAQRLIELATKAARYNHYEIAYGSFRNAKHIADFDICPHPDCVLVRADAAASRAQKSFVLNDDVSVDGDPTKFLRAGSVVALAASRAPSQDVVAEMVTALEACVALYTSPPRKFDEAMTWIGNDDKVRALVAIAIKRGKAKLAAGARAVHETQEGDEEMVPHAFNSRTLYEPGDDRDIWCKDCEYHRDHEIHRPAVPVQDALTTPTPHPRNGGVLVLNSYGRTCYDAGRASKRAAINKSLEQIERYSLDLSDNTPALITDPSGTWCRYSRVVEAALRRKAGEGQ